MEKATAEKVKAAIESLTGEQTLVLYLKGTQFGTINRCPHWYDVEKIDTDVVELSTNSVTIYFDEFEIRP